MNNHTSKISIGMAIVSFLWIIASIMLVSNQTDLILSLVLGVVGLYISYDQWFKRQMDEKYTEHERMLDSFLNFKLEVENETKTNN